MATVEVPFDPIKHIAARKGSLVGDKKVLGYIVYNMPSVGAMDQDSEALKMAQKDATAKQACENQKRAKKEYEKNRRLVAKKYYGV